VSAGQYDPDAPGHQRCATSGVGQTSVAAMQALPRGHDVRSAPPHINCSMCMDAVTFKQNHLSLKRPYKSEVHSVLRAATHEQQVDRTMARCSKRTWVKGGARMIHCIEVSFRPVAQERTDETSGQKCP
jgi:hypothetical protein